MRAPSKIPHRMGYLLWKSRVYNSSHELKNEGILKKILKVLHIPTFRQLQSKVEYWAQIQFKLLPQGPLIQQFQANRRQSIFFQTIIYYMSWGLWKMRNEKKFNIDSSIVKIADQIIPQVCNKFNWDCIKTNWEAGKRHWLQLRGFNYPLILERRKMKIYCVLVPSKGANLSLPRELLR